MKIAIALLLLFASVSPATAASLDQRAIEQMSRGDYGAAAVSLEKAIAVHQKSKDRAAEAAAWSRLGQVYIALGTLDRAIAAKKKAMALSGRSQDPLALAHLDAIEKTMAMQEFGPTTASIHSFGEQLELQAGGRLLFDLFWPFMLKLLFVMADPSWETGAFSDPTSLALITDMMSIMTGRELFAAGQVAAAREIWKAALPAAGNSDMRSGLMAGIGATYLQEKNIAEAAAWFKRAADATEAPLQGIKAPELMTSYIGSERRWYYDITIETLLKNGQAEEAFDYSERSRARAFLQMIGNRRIAPGRSQAEYESLTAVQPLSVEDVRQSLPANTTLVAYFISTYGVRAWIIDGKSTHSVPLRFDRATLDRTIAWATSHRTAGARGMGTDDDGPPLDPRADEAFELLIAPIRKHIHTSRLIIVPHGELHYVPFAALRDAKRKRYLLEDYTLAFSPSASALRFLQAKESPVSGRALVLGNPKTQHASLPGSAREARAVAREFGTTAIVGPKASEDLLYGLGGKVDLLHIAAHGFYDAAKPLGSHVALAPGSKRDGKLEVHEILSAVDLAGVNLVVLSACQTAAGKRGGGDDVVGLTRAILYAGSPGVISTLWDINDEASALLMEEFYRRLRGGEPAAEALRGAQLMLLRRQELSDPRLWAAFTITGDPRSRWVKGN
jgi:tetratricopeptide (TPR) repeat protein